MECNSDTTDDVFIDDDGDEVKRYHGPWPAPAKLNLMLRILGRRSDGYHELQTVFQFIGLQDTLFFRILRDSPQIIKVNKSIIPHDDDLSVRAARALQKATGCTMGAEFLLHKCLPIGGGLGGGSSDAATTLIALNKLWGLGLNLTELSRIGLKLGADVPIFINGHAAWAEGVGEKLTPIELPELWYLVVMPRCMVSTTSVFADKELTRDSLPITMADFIAGNQVNDCLPVVRLRYPKVDRVFRWLEGKGHKVRLTGTGSSVFVGFNTENEAKLALSELTDAASSEADVLKVSGFVAKGMNTTPLARIVVDVQ